MANRAENQSVLILTRRREKEKGGGNQLADSPSGEFPIHAADSDSRLTRVFCAGNHLSVQSEAAYRKVKATETLGARQQHTQLNIPLP